MVGDLVTVSLLNRSSLLPMENISEFPEIILLTHGSTCDMLARDFDEDGDVDLILGDDKWLPSYSRYFERISAYRVVERTGDDNPLSIFNGSVQQIADIDGDGRLEIFSGQKKPFGVSHFEPSSLTQTCCRWQPCGDGKFCLVPLGSIWI